MKHNVLAVAAFVCMWVSASAISMAAPLAEEMVLIPAGPFIMGSDRVPTEDETVGVGTTKPWYLDEHPAHQVKLKAYYLDRYEVSNAQYQKFTEASGRTPPFIWAQSAYILNTRQQELVRLDMDSLRLLAEKNLRIDRDTSRMEQADLLQAIADRMQYLDNEPVTGVSWYDARAYCAWMGRRLPTEAEWEKAARGPEGNEYPWGNQWAAGKSNAGEEIWVDGVAPDGSYSSDVSAYGIYDMAGNVTEWVQDWYRPYPGATYKSKDFGKKYKVLRGAAWGREGHYAMHQFQRTEYRQIMKRDAVFDDVGFRCAKNAQ